MFNEKNRSQVSRETAFLPSVSFYRVEDQSMSLSDMPNEILIKILEKCDFKSLIIMSFIDRHFRVLVTANAETLFLARLRSSKSTSIMLNLWPYPGADILCYVKKLFRIQANVKRVAKICGITEFTEVSALYCIEALHNCLKQQQALQLRERGLDVHSVWYHEYERAVETFSTMQLQNIRITITILIYKVAELADMDANQEYILSADIYSTINGWLMEVGTKLVCRLEDRNRGRNGVTEDIQGEYKQLGLPNLTNTIFYILNKRGNGLLELPDNKIKLFLWDRKERRRGEWWGKRFQQARGSYQT